MTPARRRVVLYWLLLLGPALLVGGSTVWLLRREQTRLQVESARAAAAQQQALEDRAGLAAENLAVLLDEARDSLGQTLAQAPRVQARDFLEGLRDSNALVADVFGTRPDGGIAWGADGAPTRAWLRDAVPPDPVPERQRETSAPEMKQQLKAASNVGNYAQARSQLRELASTNRTLESRKDESAAFADTAAEPSVARAGSPSGRPETVEREAAQPVPPVRWTSVGYGESAALFAWIEQRDGGRVGLAVDMGALREQLAAALPVAAGEGEAYRWRLIAASADGGDRVFLVGVSTEWLPGWSVEARWDQLGKRSSSFKPWAGLMTSGVALVLLLVAAILIGGGLLLREARRSELEALQKTTFVGNVSHEFKTPLTTIRLYAELLEQGRVTGEARQRDYLNTIGRESARLTRLVNNALDFSRLEQGQKRFDRQPLDAAAQIGALLNAQAPRLVAAGMQVERRWPAEGVAANCDRDALDQIVLNLIDNAIKYAAAGGSVCVGIGPSPIGAGGVEITVADRGPGVGEADRERIFDKFSRLQSNLATEQTGTGLGLAIARQLARGHGGDLWCESRPGGGAVFICRL